MKYNTGDIVWLKECNPPEYEEHSPREQAYFVEYEEKGCAIVSVKPINSYHDGLREIAVDLIEGLVSDNEKERISMTLQGNGFTTKKLC